MKPYPKYKKSEVGFWDRIPEHWEKRRFGFIVKFNKGLNITKADLRDAGIPCVNYGEVHSKFGFEVNPDKHALRYVEEKYLSESPRSLLSEGDFVFADTSEDIEGSGNFTYLNSKTRAFAGYHTIIARITKPILPRYLAYQLDAKPNRAQIQNKVSGIKVFSISQGILKNVTLSLPPLPEQRAIAAYLDRETAKIDTLIEKQEQLIALLEEKRQALISHAVTKGLDPNVKMKDSGVEWLGQVPEHWTLTKIKHIKSKAKNAFVDGPFGSNLKSEHYVDDGPVKVVESGFITRGHFITKEFKTITESHFQEIRRSECCIDDIIIAKIGANYGMSGILPDVGSRAVVSGNSLKLTVNSEIVNLRYAHMQLLWIKQSSALKPWVNETAQPALSLGLLNSFDFLLPPLIEQQQIVAALDKKFAALDTLVVKGNDGINFLKEKRSSLISAAVTGKIDVRGEGALAVSGVEP